MLKLVSVSLVRRWWVWVLGVVMIGSVFLGYSWFLGRHQEYTFRITEPVRKVTINASDTLLAASLGGSGTVSAASSNADETVQVWRLEDKQLLYTLQAYPCLSGALAFHPTRNELVVGYHNGAAVVWDMTTGAQIRHLVPVQPNGPGERFDTCTEYPRRTKRSIGDIVFSPDGTLIALNWGGGGGISLVDVATGVELWRIQLPLVISTLTFTPDQETLVVGQRSDSTTYVIRRQDGSVQDILTDGNAIFSVTTLGVDSQDTRLLVARPGLRTVDVYSIANWTLQEQIDLALRGCDTWAFVPNQAFYACGGMANRGFFANLPIIGADDPHVYVGSLHTPNKVTVLRGHRDFVTSLAFSHNGRWLFSGSLDGTVRWWRVPK